MGRINGIGEIDVCIAETADRSIDIDVIKKAMLQQYPVRCPAIIVETVAARTIQWRHQKVEFTQRQLVVMDKATNHQFVVRIIT